MLIHTPFPCLLAGLCVIGLYTGLASCTDTGGRCLMLAQNICTSSSSALIEASVKADYGKVCKMVEQYNECITNSMTEKLKCSMTQSEQYLHSKNILGYRNSPYNCVIKVSTTGLIAESYMMSSTGLSTTTRDKTSSTTSLLKILLTALITLFLYCIIN